MNETEPEMETYSKDKNTTGPELSGKKIQLEDILAADLFVTPTERH